MMKNQENHGMVEIGLVKPIKTQFKYTGMSLGSKQLNVFF